MTCFEGLMLSPQFCGAIERIMPYTYALGNRTRMVENRLIEGNIVTTVFDYTYDAANQLLRIDGSDGSFTEFTYDANGNMTGEIKWKAPKGKSPSLDENRSYFYDSIAASSALG